jgi:hypothetical protein
MIELCPAGMPVKSERSGPSRQAILLFCAMLAATMLSVSALARSPQASDASAVKAQVSQFGVGKDVKVTLVGGQKVHGRIAAIGAESFTVSFGKRRSEKAIPYNQVVMIKDPSRRVKWILIGAAIVIAIIIIAVH